MRGRSEKGDRRKVSHGTADVPLASILWEHEGREIGAVLLGATGGNFSMQVAFGIAAQSPQGATPLMPTTRDTEKKP
jgi:hypothetical protein